MAGKTLFFFIAACFLLIGSCSKTTSLTPFTTDHCSLFPDGTWAHCCYNHDIPYWHGGNAQARKKADETLRTCVAETGHPTTAALMYFGVRIFGAPYIPLWFRWGYGWPFPRGYKLLTDEEKLQVKQIKPASRPHEEESHKGSMPIK